MNYVPIYRITLGREGSLKAQSRAISSPHVAYAMLRDHMADSPVEQFVMLLLDTRNRVIGIRTVTVGTLNASLVHPREVFGAAILANAASIIVGHCHPSGDPDPSQEDLAITARLKQAGEILGIPLLDHVILGNDHFASLKERGLL